ncbi:MULTISPECIES: hypothetical protein [unclassified Clostridium]|uniref:hypothetical protein n=1 Tax=unclassified Clostridium TaxID=2614128 RepID=UPI001898C623|nr:MULTISPECIES: hypothetical protein [unclassified Clostridium]MCR1950791.1 hypothetical protein [Clostridium sp. DSM 100503]
MKFDMIYLIQLVFIFSIATYIYICFKGYVYRNKEKFNKAIFNNLINKERLDFSKILNADGYKTYEKIDIWRYCTLF